MDPSLPGSSVHGISQARILEWVAVSFSRGSSQPKGQSLVSCIVGRFFTSEPLGKPLDKIKIERNNHCFFFKYHWLCAYHGLRKCKLGGMTFSLGDQKCILAEYTSLIHLLHKYRCSFCPRHVPLRRYLGKGSVGKDHSLIGGVTK